MVEINGKKKIALLAISNGNTSGVAYFRMRLPMEYLQKHSDDFDILYTVESNINLESEELNLIDIVHFHANCTHNRALMLKILEMQKRGCKLVMDLDDFFEIPKHNPHHKSYMEKLNKPIKAMLLKVDYLTTTTKLFKEELKKWTKKSTKIFVLPNVIDKEIPQFNRPIEYRSGKLRVGLLCGASHQKDIELLSGMVKQLENDLDKIQFVLCGFDTRLNKHPELSVWNTFEQVLTNDYTTITTDYRDYLMRYEQESYPLDVPYKRVWAKDIDNYAELYDNLDVLLAPLVNDKFNCMKSELKIVEAGMMGKVFIGSDVGIYKEVITNGYDGLLVKPNDNITGWSTHIKRLLNPDVYDILQANLYELVANKYNIEKWNYKRIEFYKKIVK